MDIAAQLTSPAGCQALPSVTACVLLLIFYCLYDICSLMLLGVPIQRGVPTVVLSCSTAQMRYYLVILELVIMCMCLSVTSAPLCPVGRLGWTPWTGHRVLSNRQLRCTRNTSGWFVLCGEEASQGLVEDCMLLQAGQHEGGVRRGGIGGGGGATHQDTTSLA